MVTHVFFLLIFHRRVTSIQIAARNTTRTIRAALRHGIVRLVTQSIITSPTSKTFRIMWSSHRVTLGFPVQIQPLTPTKRAAYLHG